MVEHREVLSPGVHWLLKAHLPVSGQQLLGAAGGDVSRMVSRTSESHGTGQWRVLKLVSEQAWERLSPYHLHMEQLQAFPFSLLVVSVSLLATWVPSGMGEAIRSRLGTATMGRAEGMSHAVHPAN